MVWIVKKVMLQLHNKQDIRMNRIIPFLAVLLLLPACTKKIGMNHYTYDELGGGLVFEGIVVTANRVTIGPDDLKDNGFGGLTGATAGMIGTAGVGGSPQTRAGAVLAGAVAGGMVGALAEQELSTQEAMSYTVKLREERSNPIRREEKVFIREKTKPSSKIVNAADTSLRTTTVKVTQGLDHIFKPGDRVYVEYSDERLRIIPYVGFDDE